jgi:hypothetical protein
MIPIGIVTKDRHPYLDLTLRSISASELPDDQILVIYDDHSKDSETKKYLYTDKQAKLHCPLPRDEVWKALGLDDVYSRDKGPGLAGKISVRLLGDKSIGVMNASCRAIKLLWHEHRQLVNKNGLLLVQDDVVFNPDWMSRIEHAIKRARKSRPALGMLCGMRLNTPLKAVKPNPFLVRTRGVTAQCYYLSPAGLKAAEHFILNWHKSRQGFDNKMCARVRGGRTGVYLMQPAVCQHIGIVSAVRPKWKWRWRSKKGRVGYQSRGPFPLAEEVRAFMK